MNLYSFSVLIFAIGSIFMAIQILVRRRDIAGAVYFFLSILYSIWGIGFALCMSGNLSYEAALASIRIGNIAALFIPAVWLQFCLIYTNQMSPTKLSYYLLYLLPIYVSLNVFSSDFLPGLRPMVGFELYPTAGWMYSFHMSNFFIVTPIGFYQLWKSIKKLSGEEQKRQIRFLIVSCLGYIGGGLSFFPVYDIPIPQYGLFLLPLYPFGKAYFMGTSGLLFDEEQLAQAAHKDKLAALGILTASINHEIRSPLFVMRGAVESENDAGRIRDKILPQLDRITGIVSRLTHFAKKGVEEAAQIEAIDLKEVLADIRPLFQHQLNYQQIEYNQDIPSNLPKLMADRRYLEEILFNLILNACQALRETSSPKITLNATRAEPSIVTIEIGDNGPGVAPEQLKTIFKPFHTTKQEGTGLGLYITKQLIEKCGGKITVESQPGNGAKFIVSFKAQ